MQKAQGLFLLQLFHQWLCTGRGEAGGVLKTTASPAIADHVYNCYVKQIISFFRSLDSLSGRKVSGFIF